MKTLTVVLVVTVLIIHISGYLIHVPTTPIVQPEQTAPVQWLYIQKLMIPLFENVCEVSSDPVIRRLAQEYTPKSENYLEDVIPNFQNLLTTGLLPKGEIFSEYNPEHMKELKIVYEVLSSARNFNVFYETAAWARQNLNCGLYVNAIYITIQSRRDTERLSIPAPYELLPNYFVHKDVIVLASSILAGQEIGPTEAIRDEGNAYHIDANYTAMFYDNDDESKLAYFREDIGLNSHYFFQKLRMSPWFNDDINSRYGENMYHMMKQLMSRYNLERYANSLPEIDGISWNSLPNIPYNPELIYSDGNEFSHRTSPLELSVTEDLTLLQTIENNIVTVVGHMRQSGYNKTQILNHLMEILVTGDRSYETLARRLLGKDPSYQQLRTNNGHTSVLEHYMTSLRDPVFWKINKHTVDLIDSALQTLPAYSRNELYFPGVEVVNIEVKKMMTAYDYFEFDVTNALKIDDIESQVTTFNIEIGQPRLNHKPFTIKLNISSLVSKKGLVKIYLGPKVIPGELAMKKNLFMLLDLFEIDLKIGTNIISRTSDDMKQFSGDFMSLKTICKKVEDAEFGLNSLPQKTIESQIQFPSRLILPKGSPQGLPLQIFVFIAPFTKISFSDSYSTNTMEFNSAILSPGYPLDLMIEDRQLFTLPNALIKYITVTQKGDNKVENYGGPGVTKHWYGTKNFDSTTSPDYSTGYKKSYDYNSNKVPYSNNKNNFAKVNEYNKASRDIFEEENQSKFEDDTGVPRLLKSSKSYVIPLPIEHKEKCQSDKKDYFPKRKDYLENPREEIILTNTPYSLYSPKIGYLPTPDDKKSFEYIEQKAMLDKKEDKADYSTYRKLALKEKTDGAIPSKSTTINDNFGADFKGQKNGIIDTPLLLKSSLDSSTKSEEPFDYKSKKAQFVKKDYSVNKDGYFKYHTVTPTEENISIVSPITTAEDYVINSEVENEDNTDAKKHIQNSAKFDYSSKYKSKKPFDYKANKPQFDKKDYSANRKNYIKYDDMPREEIFTNLPESTSELPRVTLNKDANNVDLINEIINKDIYTKDRDNLDKDDDPEKALIDETPTLSIMRKHTPTVYDFLFHTFDYDDYKVYE